MTRLFRASVAVVSVLAVVPCAVHAQKETPKKGALSKFNQVYVKVIWPAEPATQDADRPIVESWIAERLKKGGASKFTAATAWVPLLDEGDESRIVWYGGLDGKARACPVSGHIVERANGRIKVRLEGWAPVPGFGATVSLKDEPGSRAMGAVEGKMTGKGLAYVAVLIGPPPEKSASRTDEGK